MISIKSSYSFCREDIALIENYDKAIADNTQTWICHHRLEVQGKSIMGVQDLINRGLYYNRPACELIFLTPSQHSTLHNANRKPETFQKISRKMKGNKNCLGRVLSESTKKLLSEQRIGKMAGAGNPMYGRHHSLESKQKISNSNKGHTNRLGKKHSEETKQKMKDAWVRRKQKQLEVKYTKGG